MRSAALAVLAAVAASAPGQGPAPPPAGERTSLRYDLRSGDRIVYRESLNRKVRTARDEQEAVLGWDAHVVVTDAGEGSARVGIQRTRTRGDLVRYVENGREALAEGRRVFAEQLAARGPSFAEANWITPRGAALLPWSAVREASSERLPLFHELEPWPEGPVGPGDSFPGTGLLSMPMKAMATEAVAGEPCLRLEGAAGDGALRLREWHCPASGTLGRLEYDARYGTPGGGEVTESYRIERASIARGEPVADWLRGKDTALAALAALAVSTRLPVDAPRLYAALDGASPAVERLVLAVAWRHRLPPPPSAALARLAASPDARVRALAARHLRLAGDPASAALRERLAGDADPYVRAAAVPPPAPEEGLARAARAVRGTDPLPAWAGPVDAGVGRLALSAQRVAGQPPGATLRFMRSRPGWPYVLHVPEEYRGDEPFPLVFVLGGGPGRAIPTAQTARSSVDARGAIAVFPQANGMWWDDASADALDALFSELVRELNVDTDRVSITGFSNGGTGSLLHAARHPDRFAAVAPLMGAGLPFFQELRPIDVDAVARLPFLFVHGTSDATIPSWASERTAKAILKANPAAEAELHLLPGRGHDVVFGRDEGLTFPFLERHARDPFPRTVALRGRGGATPRAFWIEVTEKTGGAPQVDGAIEGQAVTLRTRGVRRLRLLLRPEHLDLARPVRVTVDGRAAFEGALAPDPALFLRTWRETLDPQLAAAAEIVLDVK